MDMQIVSVRPHRRLMPSRRSRAARTAHVQWGPADPSTWALSSRRRSHVLVRVKSPPDLRQPWPLLLPLSILTSASTTSSSTTRLSPPACPLASAPWWCRHSLPWRRSKTLCWPPLTPTSTPLAPAWRGWRLRGSLRTRGRPSPRWAAGHRVLHTPSRRSVRPAWVLNTPFPPSPPVPAASRTSRTWSTDSTAAQRLSSVWLILTTTGESWLSHSESGNVPHRSYFQGFRLWYL